MVLKLFTGKKIRENDQKSEKSRNLISSRYNIDRLVFSIYITIKIVNIMPFEQ